jgi:dihydrolipoamide dehydrogenase
MSENKYDLCVIGAGPGGYAAAVKGAKAGLKTILIEKEDRLGGTCLLKGCIPTKALIQSAETYETCKKSARQFGVTTSGVEFDWAKVIKRKEMVITKGTKGIEMLMNKHGVTVLCGTAKLDAPGKVTVGDETVTAENIILATGSKSASIPGVTPDGKKILTSTHLLNIDELPESIIILGAGAVGVEFADLLATFGTKVTLVEMLPTVLPIEDPEVSAELEQALKRKRIKLFTSTRAGKVEVAEKVTATLVNVETKEEQTIEADCMLVATGRKPVTENLGLENFSVVVDRRGFIQTDAHMQTAQPGLYAIGDIVATPQLAHVATAEAIVAVDAITNNNPTPINYDAIPSCTYSSPEVASVGLNEEEAINRGHKLNIGKFPFSALGKASILGKPQGFVKIIADAETDVVLGAHMVGPHVTDMIAEVVTVLGAEMTAVDWGRVIHPHPSLSEALMEATHDVHGDAVHG